MRRGRRVLIVAAVAVLAVIGVVVAVVLGSRAGSVTAAPPTSPPPDPVVVAPQIRPVPADAPQPLPAALSGVLTPLTSTPALGTLTGRVQDAATGAVLWDNRSAQPQLPASTAKVLTVAAALLSLGPQDAVATRVVASAVPGQIVLVGGGDPTLSAAPAGSAEHYPGAARVDDLVAQVRASGVPVTSVLVDTGAYTGEALAPGWHAADIGGGAIAPIEPVMIDGARSDPAVDESPRSATPALAAGRLLAQRLGVPAQAVSAGRAEPGARQLAEVHSAPLNDRLEQLMLASDNVLAETVGREVALARAKPPSFAGAAAAVADTLAAAGLDITGLDMRDASGLSDLDRAPARLIADVVNAAAGGGPHADALRPLLSMLPVAAGSGTLADRFDGTPTRTGAGWVRAKTGTLSEVNSLAGIVTDVDGRVLTFALISNGSTSSSARPALDTVAAALRGCGCR